MKRCSWCNEAGLTKKENSHNNNEVGAIDTEGDWICDDCKEGAEEKINE